MVSGTLVLRIHRVEGLPQIEQGEMQHIAGMYYTVRVTVGTDTRQTKSHGKGHESSIEQDLTFELEGMDGRESVIVEVLGDQGTALCGGEVAILGDFIEGRKGESYEIQGDSGRTAHVVLTSKWLKHAKP